MDHVQRLMLSQWQDAWKTFWSWWSSMNSQKWCRLELSAPLLRKRWPSYSNRSRLIWTTLRLIGNFTGFRELKYLRLVTPWQHSPRNSPPPATQPPSSPQRPPARILINAELGAENESPHQRMSVFASHFLRLHVRKSSGASKCC